MLPSELTYVLESSISLSLEGLWGVEHNNIERHVPANSGIVSDRSHRLPASASERVSDVAHNNVVAWELGGSLLDDLLGKRLSLLRKLLVAALL